MKTIFKVTAVAALMAAGMSSAFAESGTDAHVEITGNVTPMSCNVGPGASTPANIFLGNATADEFKKAASGVYSSLYTVSASKKTFQVTVNGCAGATPVDGDELDLTISAQGKTLNQAQTVFGGGPGQTSDAGASLVATSSSAGAAATGLNALLADGAKVTAYKYTTAGGLTADQADGSVVQFETMMASESPKPANGGIDAPITFTVSYN